MFPRDFPPAYVSARPQIEPVLSSRGFRLTSEHFEPESFGSAYAEYRKDDFWLRLIWDGKDGWLSIDVARTKGHYPGHADWKDLELELGRRPPGIFRLDPASLPSRIGEIREAVAQAIPT